MRCPSDVCHPASQWFDGGYTPAIQARLQSLLRKYQPQAAVFGGSGVVPSALCWVGTESGHAPDPTWSTGDDGSGDPDANLWCPKECDTTLQDFDHWFWNNVTIRSLAELISVYHDSVGAFCSPYAAAGRRGTVAFTDACGCTGHNCILELDFAIMPSGRVAADHALRYKEFGDWIRSCYGSPLARSTTTHIAGLNGSLVDRVVIQEDQRFGQRIRYYHIDYLSTITQEWQPFSDGTSVGNRKIDFRREPVLADAMRMVVEVTVPPPILRSFMVFRPCPWG